MDGGKHRTHASPQDSIHTYVGVASNRLWASSMDMPSTLLRSVVAAGGSHRGAAARRDADRACAVEFCCVCRPGGEAWLLLSTMACWLTAGVGGGDHGAV